MNIKFGAVGDLPAPQDCPAPQIFLCLYHPIFEVSQKGAVAFQYEGDPSIDTGYTFTPMKPQYWTDWSGTAWEDCEVGAGSISAATPDGTRYAWAVQFSHDGDPALEFWGATFSPPKVITPNS